MNMWFKAIGGVALIAFMLIVMFRGLSSELRSEEDKFKKHIGDVCIVDKDTLTIVNYSIMSESFTLSNGLKVNYKIIGGDEN